MNNKPVAFVTGVRQFDPVMADTVLKVGTPLYTHPVKTLTDEEIMNIFNNWTNSKREHNLPANNQNYFYQEMREFARTILKKAQEK
jgi:hypothetical protein